MSTLRTIIICLLVVLVIIAVNKILGFFNISTSEYAVYLLFYLFLVITYLILPDISDPFDKNE
jgi:surface polysaccharide O-acyltransferase-like enzyme